MLIVDKVQVVMAVTNTYNIHIHTHTHTHSGKKNMSGNTDQVSAQTQATKQEPNSKKRARAEERLDELIPPPPSDEMQVAQLLSTVDILKDDIGSHTTAYIEACEEYGQDNEVMCLFFDEIATILSKLAMPENAHLRALLME